MTGSGRNRTDTPPTEDTRTRLVSTNDRGPVGWSIPAGVVAGAALGMLVGILIEQIALALTLGAAIGLLVGSLLTALVATPSDRRATVLAVAIALLTVGAAATVLIWVR